MSTTDRTSALVSADLTPRQRAAVAAVMVGGH